MKQYLSRFLTLALIVPALASCAGQLEDNLPLAKKHTVYFSTVVDGQATRTGLSIEGNNIIPDWSKTNGEDVHVFEMMNDSESALLGEAREVIADEDDPLGAHFLADLDEEITIVVTPPSNPDSESDGAKVLRQGSKTFGAVVAKTKVDETGEPLLDDGNVVFYIPAVQTPDAKTLKDPGAEFLVGYSRDGYDSATLEDGQTIVDLYFDRVAALSRIGFTEFQGTDEKVISVKIKSDKSMTGSVKSSNISFGNSNSVSWTPDTGEGAGVLTLDYGEGADIPTDKPFYAYFVSMPGKFNITSIEVLTDQYHYTKTVGKEVVFDLTSLKNLTADLSDAEAEELASNVWYKASMLEVGHDYLIVSAGYALKNNGNGNTVAAAEVTISDNNTIELDDTEGIVWTVANANESLLENGKYTLKNGTEYLYRHGGNSTSTLEAATEPATPKYGVWDYKDGYFFNISTSYGTSTYYAYYSSGWKITTTKTAAMIFTDRAPQEPGFDPTGPFTFDIDQLDENPDANFSNEPELINYYGDVTYSSSDASIATVDPASGDVTVLKAGQVEITATAAGDAKHQAATASYLINITTSKIPTWYKADEIVAGETYLVVSHDYALDNDGSSGGKAVLLEGVSDIIQYDAPATMIWTATNESSGKFRLTGSDGKVIRLSSSSFQIGSASQTESNNQWSLNADGKLVNGNYYLYYSTSQSKWAVNNSASDTHSGYLYSSNPGRAPRNLSFGEDPVTVTHDLANGTDVAEPTLTGDKIDDVTYEVTAGSNIASVNATTGEVTLTGTRGSATITASATKTDTFKAESVSYTLKVIDSSIPVRTYTKVTSVSDLEVGTQYLLVFEGLAGDTDGDGDPKVFLPIKDTDYPDTRFLKKTTNALDVEISDDTITSSDFDECHLTLEAGYYLKVDKFGNYLYPGSEGTGTNVKYYLFAESTATNAMTIGFTNKYYAQIAIGSKYLVWSTSNHYFSCNNTIEGSYSTGICLYKLDDGRQPQTLSFSPANATFDLYNPSSFVKPTLSTAYGDVTYSSSDATIAEVDNSGKITGKKKGTVTITATAAGDSQYKPGSASYTLTVENSDPSGPVYTKVTSSSDLVVGGKYLLVYEGGSKVFKPILASSSSTSFTKSTENALSVEISNETITDDSLEDCQLTLEDGYYLYVSSAAKYIYPSSGTLSAESSKGSSHNLSISFDNGFALLARASGTAYQFCWSSSNYFSTSSSTKNIALYVLYDGSPKNQNLKFSSTAVSYNMASPSAFTAPTLSGAKTSPVTYDSSNTSVATVTSDGEVSIVGVGVTTITANAPAGTVNGTEYKAGSASYTLTVKNEAVVYYTKVSDTSALPTTTNNASGNYIFVYENGSKAYVFKAICDGTPTGAGNSSSGHVELTKVGSAIEVDLTADGIEATDQVKACKLQFKQKSGSTTWYIQFDSENNWWLRINSSNNMLVAMTSSGYGSAFAFSGDGNNLTLSRTDSNTSYMVFNTTNEYFEASSTSSKISVYQLSE